MDSCLLIHSSLSHLGPAKKAKLSLLKQSSCVHIYTVSLHCSYVNDDYTQYKYSICSALFLDGRVSTCNMYVSVMNFTVSW